MKSMKYIIYTIIAFMLIGLVSAASMDRQVPSISTSSTFQITYQTSGTSGRWGASIEDTVSGGCTFPSGGTTYRSVMISDDGSSKTIYINANGASSCSFSGNYKFGEDPVQNFAGDTITLGGPGPVCGNSQCESGETQSSCPQDCGTAMYCGDGTCNNGETQSSCSQDCGSSGCTCTSWVSGSCDGSNRVYSRTCTPNGCMTQSKAEYDSSCSGGGSTFDFCTSAPWVCDNFELIIIFIIGAIIFSKL